MNIKRKYTIFYCIVLCVFIFCNFAALLKLKAHQKRNDVQKRTMARNQKITPIRSEVDRNVYMTLTIDRRGKSSDDMVATSQKFPMVVIVAYKSRKYYYRTGTNVTESEYDKILKSSIKGAYFEVKKKECVKFDTVVKKVKDMLDNDDFTLELFKNAINSNYEGTFSSLFLNNIKRLRQENRIGTAESYLYVYKKFSSYYGEGYQFEKITPQLAIDFKERMERDGLTSTTVNIYLRTLRIHCNIALEEGFIKHSQYPFGKKQNYVKIPKAAKRKDFFLTVEEILKLKEYDTPEHRETPYGVVVCEALNLWLFAYLGNGLNLADMADLKYSNHYFKTRGKEFDFVRKKTERTSKDEIKIYIPIIDALREIVDRYGSVPRKGAHVFPQILNGVTDPEKMKKLVSQYNSNIKDRLQKVCVAQGINAPVSMTWARHSFNTNLAHKKVPESYISQAMGHSTESITAGYTGMYSTEDRFRYNSLLLEPDKEA